MTIQYNETLRTALLEEMTRISEGYRIPYSLDWATKEAREYHATMYRVLELMVHHPLSISVGDNYEK